VKRLPDIDEEVLRHWGFSEIEVEIYRLLKKAERSDENER